MNAEGEEAAEEAEEEAEGDHVFLELYEDRKNTENLSSDQGCQIYALPMAPSSD